jgi:V8-like Glu-specific endopeptidase
MFEMRWFIINYGHGVQPDDKKLQYRQVEKKWVQTNANTPMGAFAGSQVNYPGYGGKQIENQGTVNGYMQEQWSDWIDVPTIKEE